MHRIDRKVFHTALAAALLITGMYWLAGELALKPPAAPLLADQQPQAEQAKSQATAP